MAHPSPLFDASFQRQCRALHRLSARSVGRHFLARRPSSALAGGTEATGHSDYVTGDEFRYIDWNLSARHDELRTRRFQGTEDHRVYLLIDASRSMARGEPPKFDFARRAAAALASVALANLDSVSIGLVSDRLVVELPPCRGARQFPRVLRFLAERETDGAVTRLQPAVQQLVARRRPGMTVVISDLFDEEGFEPALNVLRRRRFEPFVLHVIDPADASPPLAGPVSLVDAERGGRLSCILSPRDVANYRLEFESWCGSLKSYCARYDLGTSQAMTDEPATLAVLKMIRGAASRLKRL